MISSTAIFAASDIEATLTYYKDVLGFPSTWTYEEPPNFGGASMGGVSLMFCLQPGLAGKVQGHQHWIRVDDADELYAKHRVNSAKIVEEIEDRPWGVREYVVEDLNGYHLRFAGPLLNEAPKSQPFPEGVVLERRKPTKAEFAAITGATFGYKDASDDLLNRTWGGVVALSPSGETIGLLRIVQDAGGWFSIWDVAVLEEWQAKRIGTRMMEEAMKWIGEASPGAFVYLFTMKHGFYERLGFGKETVSMRKV